MWAEDAAGAGGGLFHDAVERFNRLASTSDEVRSALHRGADPESIHQALGAFLNAKCVNMRSLADRSKNVREGFSEAARGYSEELSKLIAHALRLGIDADEVLDKLFGDPRKRVDVTFHICKTPIRVHGELDYIFFDWRTTTHRVIEYQLVTNPDSSADMVQASTYALMHHKQHDTAPDVAVFYLQPCRTMIEKPWTAVWAERHRIFDLLECMAGWAEYGAKTAFGSALKPPGNDAYCGECRWRTKCQKRLGPTAEGEYRTKWAEAANRGDATDPTIETNNNSDSSDLKKNQAGGFRPPQPDLPSDGSGGLYVGTGVADSRDIVVPTSVLNTHVAVVGAAGSGKTWIAKVIAEEAVRNGVPVLAIDPQGDLVQFLKASDPNGLSRPMRRVWEQFREKVDVRVYTPGTSHGTRLSLNPIRLVRPEDLARIERPERRAEERRSILHGIASSVASLAAGRGDLDVQVTFLYAVLQAFGGRTDINLADIARGARDPESIGIEDPDLLIKKSTRQNLATRLMPYVRGPDAELFRGGTPFDLDTLLATDSQSGRVPLNVIYLNALTNDATKQFVVASAASEIYRWMVSRVDASLGKTNLLFYIDEAKDYAPAGGSKPAAKEPIIRLFSQGRKYGVGCLLCTQSPRSVDYNAFSNCSSKVIGRLESAQDVERVREWFTTGGSPKWLGGRTGAESGSFVARWADCRGDGLEFRSRALCSTHENAWAPDRVEREVHTQV